MAARHEITKKLARLYARADKTEKGRLLDRVELVEAGGVVTHLDAHVVTSSQVVANLRSKPAGVDDPAL